MENYFATGWADVWLLRSQSSERTNHLIRAATTRGRAGWTGRGQRHGANEMGPSILLRMQIVFEIDDTCLIKFPRSGDGLGNFREPRIEMDLDSGNRRSFPPPTVAMATGVKWRWKLIDHGLKIFHPWLTYPSLLPSLLPPSSFFLESRNSGTSQDFRIWFNPSWLSFISQ